MLTIRLFIRAFLLPKNLILFAAFCCLGASVHLGYWHNFNLWTTRAVQSFAGQPLDYFFALYSYLGSPEVTGLACVVVVFLLWRRYGLNAALLFVYSMMAVTAIELIGKYVIFNPGPSREFQRWPWGSSKMLMIHVDTPNAFPSGHVIRTVFLLMIGSLLIKETALPRRWVMAVSCVLTALMVVNRVYLGDHWISDAAGGLLLAYLGYSWTAKGILAQRQRL